MKNSLQERQESSLSTGIKQRYELETDRNSTTYVVLSLDDLGDIAPLIFD